MKIVLLLLLCCTFVRAEVQRERFDFHLKDLKKQLKIIEKYKTAKDAEGIAKFDDAIKAARTPAFMLESLFEAYKDEYPDEMEGLKELVKTLEDETGRNIDRLDHMNTLSNFATESGKTKELAPTIDYMKARSDEARHSMIKTLEKAKWLKSPLLKKEIEEDELKHPGETAFDRIVRKLDKVEWDSKKDDRDFLAEYAIKFIDKHLMDGSQYDLTDLNGPMGLHKRRREDRKLAMLMSATNGLFVLTDEDTPKAYKELLTDPIAKGKYANLPQPSEGKRHIFIPRGLFLEMNKSIDAFGRAKDFGEAMDEWLPEMLLGSGTAKNEKDAHAKARDIVSSWKGFEEPIKIAKTAYKRLLSPRKGTSESEKTVYQALSSAIEEQIGMDKKTDCTRLAAAVAK